MSLNSGRYEIKKIYFKINEVANQLEVSTALIRFWEKELDLNVPTRKGAKKIRIYQQKHIDILKFVKKSIRQDKYTLQGVKSLLKKRKDNPLPENLIPKLKEARDFFISFKDNL